ncbi:hypothetical protein HQ590_04690 [bacterium]|nr:hypothetical protein [bacterium]
MTTPTADKWRGLPLYDRPLGARTRGIDDGRPVVTIPDFSKGRPAAAVSPGPRFGAWQVIDYATEEFQGQLLYARRDAPAPDLTLRLNLKGWYAVYVWLMGGDVDLEPGYPDDFDSVYSLSRGPALKLSKDRHYSGLFATLSHDKMMWCGLEGCFWRYADLTGQSLRIRHQGHTVYLGALRFVPLSAAEVKAVQADRAAKAHKRLIVKGDCYTPQEAEVRIEQFRHRDIQAWISGCENSAELAGNSTAPGMVAMRQATREIGCEWYVGDRPSLWSLWRYWPDRRASFYAEHPEWHCRDRDGTDTHQLSYAVPEVQDYMLARVRAVAEYGVDGFGYFFNRDPGLVLFEDPARRGFAEKHGVDPRTLDDRDPRLLDWRADIITGYLHRVRQTLDEAAQRRRLPRIKMIAVTLGDEAANRYFSFDVARWVREGLVDVLCPYPWTDYPDRWLAQGFVDVDVPYFASLVRGTKCQLYPMWLACTWRKGWTPENVRPSDYFTRAAEQYAAGADGISAWDEVGLDQAFRADRWLRLGHREKLAEWAAADFPLPPKLRFTRFASQTPDRYPAGTGG